jgi:GNAT superfamily N-acetyltransferase
MKLPDDADHSAISVEATLRKHLFGNDHVNNILHQFPLQSDSILVSGSTGLQLPTYILRERNAMPPMARLLDDIVSAASARSWSQPPSNLNSLHPTTIDYVYFRQEHLSDVNALLQRQFWPGINVAAELAHPEHGVVVLYGRRIIGCGFVEVSPVNNQAYVTYVAVDDAWQNGGIGSRLLYFLLRMYRHKDYLLHVSATNGMLIFRGIMFFLCHYFNVPFSPHAWFVQKVWTQEGIVQPRFLQQVHPVERRFYWSRRAMEITQQPQCFHNASATGIAIPDATKVYVY